jgi:hypothetical protein
MAKPGMLDLGQFFRRLKPEIDRICRERRADGKSPEEAEEVYARRRINFIRDRAKRQRALSKVFNGPELSAWRRFYGHEDDDFVCGEYQNERRTKTRTGEVPHYVLGWKLNPEKWKMVV